MLIQGLRPKAGVGEQGKLFSPGRQMADLLVKRGEKRGVNPFGQPPGDPGNMGLIPGKEESSRPSRRPG